MIVPVVVPVTLSEITHELDAANVAPDKLTAPDPFAVMVPPQLLVRLLVEEIASPAGKLSANATLDNAELELGLLMLNVRLVMPSRVMPRLRRHWRSAALPTAVVLQGD